MASSQDAQSSCPGSEEEEVRPATLLDKEAVLKIDPNYHGLDYLADCYTSYTQGPGSTGYVLKKGDEVVGFFSCQLVDAGHTLVTSGGRILEGHRGGGFYGRATKKVFETFRGSGLCNIAMVLNNVNLKNYGDKLLKQYQMVHSRESAAYTVDMDAIRKSDLSKTAADMKGIHQLTSEEELQLLMSVAGDCLFPEGRVLIELKPFRIMEENARFILHGGTHERAILVSGAGTDLSSESPEKYSAKDLLFSCGSYFYNQVGVSYLVDMYATGIADSSEEVQKHLEWHFLRLINTLKPSKAYFHVFFERQLNAEMEALSSVYPNTRSDFPFTKMSVLEMEYKQ
ncbi:probable N-acetyltransferase 16 [Littorina saxatilis]|uniref:N-acetyltransferase domain-containing protein n=1 Tax=Littorina saxatilis TaxID=31220 RepID=A0AAN9BTZ5_9CAEN